MSEATLVRAPALGRRQLVAVVLVALVVRLFALWVTGSLEPARGGDAWTFGQEMACMASSLAREGLFGDPWGDGTGASAWLTPLYPGLMAACLRLAGGVNALSAGLVLGAQVLFSLATCALLAALGTELGAPRAGRAAAWIFALLPAAIWNSAHAVWDTSAVACALTAFLWLCVRVGPRPSPGRAALVGLAFGGLCLLNPAGATFGPGTLLFLKGDRDARSGAVACGTRLRRWLLFCGCALAVCLPWMLRNEARIGTLGLRSNLGVELRVGNNDQAHGRHEVRYHPSHTPAELARYIELGELEYCRQAGADARAWIAAHPRQFTRLVLYRVFLFWFGESPAMDPRVDGRQGSRELALAWVKWAAHALVGVLGLLALTRLLRGHEARPLIVLGCWLFPLPYYLTHVAERYRFPIEGLLILAILMVVRRLALRSPRAAEPAGSAAPHGS